MKTTTVVGAVLGAIIRVLAVVAVVYLIYEGSVICYDYGFRIFTEPAMTTEERSSSSSGSIFTIAAIISSAVMDVFNSNTPGSTSFRYSER